MNLVFIHNPKTGGASIRSIFPSAYEGHVALDTWINRNGRQLVRPDLFIAVFIRDPWERLWSWYWHNNYNERETFEHYVVIRAKDELYRAGRVWTPMRVARQENWVESTTRAPDFVGRFESLQSEYERLYREVGKTGPIPELPHKHLSTKERRPYFAEMWTPKMLEVMAPMFEPFAERYGYG